MGKLQDITRGLPTDKEADALFEAFLGNNPIVAAILGQCMVEYELDRLLRFAMKKTTEAKWDELTKHDAPLGTFSRKITLASALGLISDETKSKLKKIGVVRNQFAHAKRLIKFSELQIANEMRGAQFTKGEAEAAKVLLKLLDSGIPSACLKAYQQLCQMAAVALLKRHSRGLKIANKNIDRAAKRKTAPNPFAIKPRGLFGHTRGLSELLTASLETQTGNPKSQSDGYKLGGLLQQYIDAQKD